MTPTGQRLIKDHSYWLTPTEARRAIESIEREAVAAEHDRLREIAKRIDTDLPDTDALAALDGILAAGGAA